MSLRLSEEEARALGIKLRGDGTGLVDPGQRGKPSAGKRKASPPHDKLWAAMSAVYGASAQREYKNAVPGRRFSCDIAIPTRSLVIEIDGWQSHGKTLEAFKKDRERQNLLVLNGWYVLRFFPAQIFGDIEGCMRVIEAAYTSPFAAAAAATRRC